MGNTFSKQPFEILHRLSRSISQAGNLEEIYRIILDEIVNVMGVERASIMRFDPRDQVLRIVAAKGIDPEIWKSVEIGVGEGVSGRVWQEAKPVLIKKMKPNPRYQSHSFLVAPVTAFPMKVGVTPVGLINLTDKKSGRPFTESDLKLLMTLSDHVASYMHIYDLIDQLKGAEQAKLQLELAREIQQKLLPKNLGGVTAGLEIKGHLIPAERVGADYYDCFGLGKSNERSHQLGLCIADVSGHNVGGALLAFALRACLKSEATNGGTPAQIMERVNRLLFPDFLQSEQFVSLFYTQYDAETKKLTYTNAGHNPPLLWHGRKKKGEWLLTQDSLLGIDSNLIFHQKETLLETGDILILYTDGLIEALGPKTGCFGTEGLLKVVQETAHKNASEILEILLASLQEFIGRESPKDDVTLVVSKVI